MKTNFITLSHLVLMSDSGTILGVIRCEPGLYDITKKLRSIIASFEDCDIVQFDFDGWELDSDSYEINFSATSIYDSGEIEAIEHEYSLTLTSIY